MGICGGRERELEDEEVVKQFMDKDYIEDMEYEDEINDAYLKCNRT